MAKDQPEQVKQDGKETALDGLGRQGGILLSWMTEMQVA